MEVGRAGICSAGSHFLEEEEVPVLVHAEVVGKRINHHLSFEAVSMVVAVWLLLTRVPPEGFHDTSRVR